MLSLGGSPVSGEADCPLKLALDEGAVSVVMILIEGAKGDSQLSALRELCEMVVHKPAEGEVKTRR